MLMLMILIVLMVVIRIMLVMMITMMIMMVTMCLPGVLVHNSENVSASDNNSTGQSCRVFSGKRIWEKNIFEQTGPTNYFGWGHPWTYQAFPYHSIKSFSTRVYLQFCIRGYAMTQFSIALVLMEGCAFAYHKRKKMKIKTFWQRFSFWWNKIYRKEFRTKVIPSNGLNPVYNEDPFMFR